MHASASEKGNPEGKAKVRKASWIIFSGGFALLAAGFTGQYFSIANGIGWLQGASFFISIAGSLCCLVAPFFSKRDLLIKIGLSVLAFFLVSLLFEFMLLPLKAALDDYGKNLAHQK